MGNVRGANGASPTNCRENYCRRIAVSIAVVAIFVESNQRTLAHPGAEPGDSVRASKVSAALSPAGAPRSDSLYAYFSKAGTVAYSDGNYVLAEQLFSDALSEMRKQKIKDSRLAVGLANLASGERQQHRYEESDKIFKQALSVLKAQPTPDEACLKYIVKQYAGLLRKMNRITEADFFEQAPQATLNSVTPAGVLKGRVEQNKIEISADHPFNSLIGAASKDAASRPLIDSVSNIPVQGLSGSAAKSEIPPVVTPPASNPDTVPVPPTAESGQGTEYNAWGEQTPSKGSMTIRLQGFGVFQRNVLDALHMALYLLRKGVEVTLMLDKEGVRVASRSYNDAIPSKGQAQLESIHPLLLDFILKGGKVIASKSWADDYGFTNDGSMASSVKLLTDEELADEYFKRKGEILEY